MPTRNLDAVLTIVGLLVFLFGVVNLLPCLHTALTLAFPVGNCWSDFLLALVGALLFTRNDGGG